MVMANKLAVKMGLMSEDEALRVERLLQKYDLETRYEVKDAESLLFSILE